MQKKNYLRKTLALVMAFLMIVTMMPVNVFADSGFEMSPQETPQALKAANQFPNNIKTKVDWDQKKDASTYWGLNQEYGLAPVQRIAKVGTDDPINVFDVDYEGYFVNAEGRTVLRLVYREQEAATSSWWNDLAFRFEPDLYNMIDFSKSEAYGIKSGAVGFQEGVIQFYDRPGSNEKALNIYHALRLRNGYKENVPINIVLKEGIKYSDLNKNYLIQMRYVRVPAGNRTVEDIYAFAPGKSTIGYTSYTRATVIPAAGSIDNEFMRGPQHDGSGNDGWVVPSNRAFMNQYFENPGERDTKYKKYDNLGIISAEYQFIHGNINDANTLDGKPLGFMIAFDARLVPYLTKDPTVTVTNQDQEIIAYTHLLDEDRTPTNTNSQAIKRENINYSTDGNTAYIVFGESNFVKDGVKVVRVPKLNGYVINGRSNITTIDFFVDKGKFKNTFQTTGKNDERFNIMAGFVEPNTTGMTIFEKTYDNGLTIPNRSDIYVDTGSTPEGKFIFVQAGSDQDTFLKRPQGYYIGMETASNTTAAPRDEFEKIGDGYYRVPFRDGGKLETGDKLKVYMPDTSDHSDKIMINPTRTVTNATQWNQGGVNFEVVDASRLIKVHFGKRPDKVELIYTRFDEDQPRTVTFTKKELWKVSGNGDELNTVNASVLNTGGDYTLDITKLKLGEDVIAKSYVGSNVYESKVVTTGEVLNKSQERFEGLVFTDNSESLGSILVNKSLFTPYARIFTNDYVDSNQKDVYDAYDIKPVNKNSFMTNTASIKAYSSYEGSPATMRYIPLEGDIYYQTVSSIENPRDKDGFETEDKSRSISVPESERDPVNKQTKAYNKYQFDMPLNKFTKVIGPDNELVNQTLALKKDMRLLINNTKASSLPSDWYETRVRTRVLFDLNKDMDFNVDNGIADSIVKIVPDNTKYASDTNYTANGFSEKSGAQKLEKKYTQNVIDAEGNITQMEAELSDAELALRKWPEKPAAITTASGETKEFLGWATKQVTAEEFANLNELKTVDQWATADTTGYKVTEDSPFDSHQVLYAVYGESASAVFNPEQKYDEETDKQYIEGTLKSGETQPTDPNTEYKLVQKNPDGKYTEVNVPVTKDGDKITFDVKNDNIVHDGVYYIETTEPGKAPSYSERPVKIDKEAPVESTVEDEKLKATPDLFKYMVKITGKATDADNKILKATVEANGKTVAVKATTDDTNFAIELNDDTLKQLGEAVSYKVTIYDEMGNKFEKTLIVKKVDQDLRLEIGDPLADESQFFLKSKIGADLTIRIIRKNEETNKNEAISLDKVTAKSDDFEAIELKQNGTEFKLKAGDRIIVDAKLDGYKDARIMRVAK